MRKKKFILFFLLLFINFIYSKRITSEGRNRFMNDYNTLVLHFTADNRLPFDWYADWIAYDAFMKGLYGILANVTPNGLWSTDSETLLDTIETENGDASKVILGIKRGLYFKKDNVEKEFTSEDLKFSYSIPFFLKEPDIFEKADLLKIIGMEDITAGEVYSEEKVKGITIINKYAIKIELKYPEPDFIKNLATTKYPIVSKYFYENKKADELTPGLGKYDFQSSNKNVGEAVLKRKIFVKNFPTYIKFISSPDKSGDILLENIWGNKNEDINYRKEIITNSYGSYTMGIFFNYESNLGKNPLFRKAINYAFDRNKICENIEYLIPNSEVLSHGFWGRIDTDDEQNIEKARNIISSLKNIPNPLVIKIFGQSEEELEMPQYKEIIKQLEKIGINPIFSKETNDFSMFIGGIVAHYKDPSLIFQYFVEGAYFEFAAPKKDINIKYLFDMLNKSYNDQDRIYYARRLSKYFKDNNILVPLWDFLRVFHINQNKIETIGDQPGGTQFDIWKVKFKENYK